MAHSLFGWTVWASMPSPSQVDLASDAVGVLDHIADAAIERVERGPALADDQAAIDWLTRGSSEHAESIANAGGFVPRRTPIVLLFAGATPEEVDTRSVADLTAYLASPACIGFAVVEPRARHAPRRVLRIAGALVVGVLMITAGILLTLGERTAAQQDETSGFASANKHKQPAAMHDKVDADIPPLKALETAEDSGAPDTKTDEAALAIAASTSASASASATASASTTASPASTP